MHLLNFSPWLALFGGAGGFWVDGRTPGRTICGSPQSATLSSSPLSSDHLGNSGAITVQYLSTPYTHFVSLNSTDYGVEFFTHTPPSRIHDCTVPPMFLLIYYSGQ